MRAHQWFHSIHKAGVLLALILTASLGRRASAGDVLAGVDLFTATNGSSYTVFSIPADFFDPGSDPFSGTIQLKGDPLSVPGIDGPPDTIVRRSSAASLPDPLPSSDTVPIEIVALNLVSVNPITVTYSGPSFTELWDVRITLAPTPPPPGTINILHDVADGGTFTATLPVTPLLTFTRVGDLATRTTNEPTDNLQLNLPTPWSHTQPFQAATLTIPYGGLLQSEFWPGGIPGSPSTTPQTFFLDGVRLDLNLHLVLIPEPSVLALGIVAGGLLALRKRRA